MSGVWLASFVTLWILVFLLAFFVAGTLRQVGLITLRLGDDPGALITDTGLDRGTIAPGVAGINVETGALWTSSDFDARPRVLTFVSPTCVACRQLAPHLNEVLRTRGGDFNFLVICRGDLEPCRAFKSQQRLAMPVVADPTGEVELAYEVELTPFVYVLDDKDHVLMRGVANEWRHLESLLEQEGTRQIAPWAVVEETAV